MSLVGRGATGGAWRWKEEMPGDPNPDKKRAISFPWEMGGDKLERWDVITNK